MNTYEKQLAEFEELIGKFSVALHEGCDDDQLNAAAAKISRLRFELRQAITPDVGGAVAWRIVANEGGWVAGAYEIEAHAIEHLADWSGICHIEPLYTRAPMELTELTDSDVLDSPAMVGRTKFGKGVKTRLVVDRAKREYQYHINPTKVCDPDLGLLSRIIGNVSATNAELDALDNFGGNKWSGLLSAMRNAEYEYFDQEQPNGDLEAAIAAAARKWWAERSGG